MPQLVLYDLSFDGLPPSPPTHGSASRPPLQTSAASIMVDFVRRVSRRRSPLMRRWTGRCRGSLFGGGNQSCDGPSPYSFPMSRIRSCRRKASRGERFLDLRCESTPSSRQPLASALSVSTSCQPPHSAKGAQNPSNCALFRPVVANMCQSCPKSSRMLPRFDRIRWCVRVNPTHNLPNVSVWSNIGLFSERLSSRRRGGE